jgi:hypothetical protein
MVLITKSDGTVEADVYENQGDLDVKRTIIHKVELSKTISLINKDIRSGNQNVFGSGNDGVWAVYFLDPERETLQIDVTGMFEKYNYVSSFVRRICEKHNYALAIFCDSAQHNRIQQGRFDWHYEVIYNNVRKAELRTKNYTDKLWEYLKTGNNNHVNIGEYLIDIDNNVTVNNHAKCAFRGKRTQTEGTCWIVAVLNAMVQSPCVFRQIVAFYEDYNFSENDTERDRLLKMLRDTLWDTDRDGNVTKDYDKTCLDYISSLVYPDGAPVDGGDSKAVEKLILLFYSLLDIKIKYADTTKFPGPNFQYVFYPYMLDFDYFLNLSPRAYVPNNAIIFLDGHVISGIKMDTLSVLSETNEPLYLLYNSYLDTAPMEFDWSAIARCTTLEEIQTFKTDMGKLITTWLGIKYTVECIIIGYISSDGETQCDDAGVEESWDDMDVMQVTEKNYSLREPTPIEKLTGGQRGGEVSSLVLASVLAALSIGFSILDRF